MYPYVIFDLDGTLLDTLEDIADAANWVCSQRGWPDHALEEYKNFIGNGAAKLMERVVPAGVEPTEELRRQLTQAFTQRYNAHRADKTTVYPGMQELIRELKDAGIRMAVLTNKPDSAAAPVVERYYPGMFDIVQGAIPGYPVKPDPTLLGRVMERMGAEAEKTLFVGDSNVDIQTGKNAALDSCGVLWGFRTREELERESADHLVSTAQALRDVILK